MPLYIALRNYLASLDETTGIATRIGNANQYGIANFFPAAMAFHNDKLYICDGENITLCELNITTGAATRVGNVSNYGQGSLGFINQLTGLASDGTTLYAISTRTLVGGNRVALCTVDVSTGELTLVANISGGGRTPYGITFLGDTLYMSERTNGLYTLNKATAVATRIGTGFGSDLFFMDALTNDGTKLYARTSDNKLHEVNTTTGALTQIGSATQFGLSQRGFGIAYSGGAAPVATLTVAKSSIFTNEKTKVTATFDKDVTGIAAGDFTTSVGTLSGFTKVSNTVYSIDITAPASGMGKITVTLAKDAAVEKNDEQTIEIAYTPAPTAPLKATGVMVSATDTIASISFNAIGTGGSALTKVEYSLDGGTTWRSAGLPTLNRFLIRSLSADTAYSIIIRGVNSVGNGPASDAVAFRTAVTPTAPLKATGVSVAPTQTTAVVSYDAIGNGGAALSDVEYSTDGGTNWVSTGQTGTSFTITGLTANTAYSVQIRGVNSVGNGPASDAVSFRTTRIQGTINWRSSIALENTYNVAGFAANTERLLLLATDNKIYDIAHNGSETADYEIQGNGVPFGVVFDADTVTVLYWLTNRIGLWIFEFSEGGAFPLTLKNTVYPLTLFRSGFSVQRAEVGGLAVRPSNENQLIVGLTNAFRYYGTDGDQDGFVAHRNGKTVSLGSDTSGVIALFDDGVIRTYDSNLALVRQQNPPLDSDQNDVELKGISIFASNIFATDGKRIYSTVRSDAPLIPDPPGLPSKNQIQHLTNTEFSTDIDVITGAVGEQPAEIKHTNVKSLIQTNLQISDAQITGLTITQLLSIVEITPETTLTGIEANDKIIFSTGDTISAVPADFFQVVGVRTVGMNQRQTIVAQAVGVII
ncbi:MAG: fibronectin type III domain-containing protein [Candidatus Poribacteria bacterium]|nr:fibronectin type III domain-containing protein [Candidatus Poribacteria bacterium]